MAGSYAHIVGEEGIFTMDLIDNLGDASEALEECHYIIQYLSDGDPQKIQEALDSFYRSKNA